MSMFVDRRKDNYDELLVLASDARMSRTRTNRWTTGLIISAMLGTAAYVAVMTQQVEALRETTEAAQGERDTALEKNEQLRNDRDVLQAQLDALERFRRLYAELMPSQTLSNAIGDLTLPSGPPGTAAQQTISKSNFVWMVDGSRRFPMIDGDILWVPEGGFWIRLVKDENDDHQLYRESMPLGVAASTQPRVRTHLDVLPHREKVSKGSQNCVEIQLRGESLRTVFKNQGYVDIEVTYSHTLPEHCVPGRF